MEKRMKRFLSLALALIMVIGLVPMSFTAAAEEDTTTADLKSAANFRWETAEGSSTLTNITTDGYAHNAFTKTAGTISGSTLSGAYGALDRTVTLLHDTEWTIEWQSAGDWEGMLLASANTVAESGSIYLYQNGNGILSIGFYGAPAARAYNNFGIDNYENGNSNQAEYVPDSFADFDRTATYTWRLENKVVTDENGDWVSNMVYLTTVDSEGNETDHGAMKYQHKGSAYQGESDYLSGKDLTFNVIGSSQMAGTKVTSSNFVYLDIQSAHVHTGTWTVSEDGTTLSRTCATCGAEETKEVLKYGWKVVTDAETGEQSLVSFSESEGYTENAFAHSVGTIENGVLDNIYGTLDSKVSLDSDTEWTIEWNGSGDWTGILLFTNGGNLLFRKNASTLGLALGYQSGSYFHNYGFSGTALADYITDDGVDRTYRLENRVKADGTNMVYLVIDGVEIGPMINYFYGAANQNETSNWLNGQTLSFNAIGRNSDGHRVSGLKLNYLEVWVNGAEHEHAYGDWYVNGEVLQRDCNTCDHYETTTLGGYRWEMRNNELVNIEDDMNVDNDLDLKQGSISNNTLTGYAAAMENTVTLSPDKEWVIEWQANDNGIGMLLLNTDANPTSAEAGAVYLLRNPRDILALGYSTGSFHNTGFALDEGYIKDGEVVNSNFKNTDTTIRTYRLENRLTDEGNMVYLLVDGVEMGPMDDYFVGSAPQGTTSDWLNDETLEFSYIGAVYEKASSDFRVTMELKYLQIWPNGAPNVANVTDAAGTTTGYTTLDKALTAATSGDTVSILSDVTVGTLELNKGITLDLNGKTLTAAAVVVDAGNCIIDTKGTGMLAVAQDQIAISNVSNGGYLPIWNGVDGYVFTGSISCQVMGVSNATGIYFLPEVDESLHDYLKNGSTTSGVDLKVKVNYTIDGTEKSIDCVFGDTLVQRFYAGYADGEYSLAFKLTLTGTENVTIESYEVYYESKGVQMTVATFDPNASSN